MIGLSRWVLKALGNFIALMKLPTLILVCCLFTPGIFYLFPLPKFDLWGAGFRIFWGISIPVTIWELGEIAVNTAKGSADGFVKATKYAFLPTAILIFIVFGVVTGLFLNWMDMIPEPFVELYDFLEDSFWVIFDALENAARTIKGAR